MDKITELEELIKSWFVDTNDYYDEIKIEAIDVHDDDVNFRVISGGGRYYDDHSTEMSTLTLWYINKQLGL